MIFFSLISLNSAFASDQFTLNAKTCSMDHASLRGTIDAQITEAINLLASRDGLTFKDLKEYFNPDDLLMGDVVGTSAGGFYTLNRELVYYFNYTVNGNNRKDKIKVVYQCNRNLKKTQMLSIMIDRSTKVTEVSLNVSLSYSNDGKMSIQGASMGVNPIRN